MVMKQLYQWLDEIRLQMPNLSKPQAMVLAIFSLGVIRARHCFISRVAESMGMLSKADSVERRLQRFLANPRINIEACCQHWIRWVIKSLADDTVILLVDETKLGKWLGVMVIGLAYRKRCIPLVWCCYRQDKWPKKQVKLIADLMQQVAAALPSGYTPLLQADRGIGTSPDLIREVKKLNWHFLFRVQNTTHFRFDDGRETALGSLVKRGACWSGKGHIFKKAGWLPMFAHVIWISAYEEPWCLVTNDTTITGDKYAVRSWQEQSFKDLKSSGWQWQDSQVRMPEHAQRLVLVLVLAYAWMLALGTMVACLSDELKHFVTRGKKRVRLGLFRQGLRYFYHLTFSEKLPCTRFIFIPLKPLPPKLSSP